MYDYKARSLLFELLNRFTMWPHNYLQACEKGISFFFFFIYIKQLHFKIGCPTSVQHRRISMSRARHHYSAEAEAGVNKQINMELHAMYTYLSLVS